MRQSVLTQTIRRLVALRRRDAMVIDALKAELAAQRALIREQEASLAHSRKIFDRSSAAARIGVWECNLDGERLTWTDMVYDIFDLPRGSALDRGETVALYTPESAAELERRRTKAIEDGTGFSLDAEIVTRKGNRRWIRITATVERENGVAVRIFGMKQDITEEKILSDRTRYLAEYDVLTGLANRSSFQPALTGMIGGEGALLLVDLDGFKSINDTYGHAAGDYCLQQAALRLKGIGEVAEMVARIGGDEFAILVGPGSGHAALAALAQQIIERIGRPIDYAGDLLEIGASIGIAPFDGALESELLMKADSALYAAKAAGRNTFRLFNVGMDIWAKGRRRAVA
ncbi:diguanylate cyclase domain-containing protein [Oceanibaculum pacificum]|uniref:Diguanylate cyclase n=1 Tax=Oceanibaculum pacificum TaxID=580166 RepID=A0A154W7B3_9PROT|nr:diguanylate cyclase [Oceanibaculum pacificum]KZD09419.1 diguanylate cyclase [Oceanibaculum pacificum]